MLKEVIFVSAGEEGFVLINFSLLVVESFVAVGQRNLIVIYQINAIQQLLTIL
jgi:hypothetical protein